ncbi:sensor domain-containing phosphodiesterase [Cyanobium sp. NIES-981]|uniref:sensor domain-containing diguanylate cyclase n=1 Tax=Cyanobium sp. NIES-981 TaxID=1851505 RepID=UPI0007DD8D22|nr:sensor domain-containing phosphodiesterase [Cyanobium sp. NIES-981]SBO43379.1 putative Diguanylate cyclase/phosphodiesterase [Cyanobium sp. NIES-981]
MGGCRAQPLPVESAPQPPTISTEQPTQQPIQQPSEQPTQQAERLWGLAGDGPPQDSRDSSLDHITELARRLAGTEIAMLSLVDGDLLRFRSCVGMELDQPNVPRRASLCGHAILSREPLIVADMRCDPRFQANPLVTGPPHVRFYAGFPLISASGFQLGSLCVISGQPHHLDPQQVDSLQRLAALAVQRCSQLSQLSQAGAPAAAPGAGPAAAEAASVAAGLLDREAILRQLEQRVAQAAEQPFALVRCRLRDHERIHAAFGAAMAKACLVEASRRILAVLPSGGALGVIGDGELLVLWPDPSPLEKLDALGQRLTAAVSQLHRVGDVSVGMAMAVGIAVARREGESSQALLADGGLALQRACTTRGSAWYGLDARSRSATLGSFRFASQFHTALDERDRISPSFQPIVDPASGRPHGFEALARWQHEGQLLPPDHFLPQARDAGLTGEVDLLVVEKALAALPQLAGAMGRRGAGPMLMSVNLSSGMLADPDLGARLLARLEAATLPPGWTLQVELLEEAFHASSATAVDAFLQRLAALQVSIAIDDFGTGYSSLARLISLPIQRVKLDRSFIAQLDSGSPSPRTLLSRMVLMLRDLDLAITAEGVDSSVQRDWLLEQGIRSAQGYLFSPPLPLAEAVAYLAGPFSP